MTTVYEKLITKLDLGNETKLLVVHQDDIGMCHGANTAFTDLCGIGFVNCGSLMPPCPWSLETLEICKHFNLKAKGKKIELVERIKDYQLNLKNSKNFFVLN